MRNLKKLLALVVACVMVFGVVASAAVMQFPDVASNAKYAEAVKVLSALNVINGDDKGNFNPDQNVTRAEMAKILCALISKGSYGQTASGFADVPAEHWASGYVKYAKGLGIIAGYDAYTFGPEDNVTYEQAIKLIVAALGYTYVAEDKGGYPSGYMMVAGDLKITDKVVIADATAPAKRSDIAILAYNALEVDMMERVSYGTEAKYEPVAKNLLNNKHGVYSFEGLVTDTYMNVAAMEEGEIDYTITKASAKAIATVEPAAAGDPVVYSFNDMFCQDAAATALRGYMSTAYVGENEDGEYEIIAVVAKATKTKEIEFADLDVLCDETTPAVDADEVMDIANGQFSYWSTADHDDKRPTVLDVAAGAQAIINNKAMVPATNAIIPAAGTMKLVDTNNDGEIDLFIVTEYMIGVVDSVSANSMTVRFKQGADVVNTIGVRSIALNEDAVENLKELKVTIDGAAAELTDLAENDVVYLETNGTPGASFDPTYVNIIAARKVVEGKVKSNVNSDNLVEIGDAEYEVAASIKVGFPTAGAEGKFFCTVDGTIVYSDTTATISNEYAYLYKMGTSSFGDKSVRMLTAAGEDVTYDIADRIKINDVQTSDKKAKTDYTAAQMVAIFGGVEADYYVEAVEDDPMTPEDETVEGVDNLMTPEEIIAGLIAGSITGTADLKLVAYKVSGTELTELYIANGSTTDENDFGGTASVTKEWIAATNKFKASKSLAAAAKVFMIEPTAEFADWKVVDAATLVNEKEYAVSFYGYNADGTYNVALITSGTTAANTEAAFAYFKEARETKYGEDDEDALKVYFIQGGEEKAMFVLASEGSYAVADALAEGEVFIYSAADEADCMENIAKLATPVADAKAEIFADTADETDFAVIASAFIGAGEEYMYTYTTAYEADNEVMAGFIASVDSVEGGLKVKLAVDADVASSDYVYMIPETANVVVLNNKLSKNKLYASTLDSIMPSEFVALSNGNIDISDTVDNTTGADGADGEADNIDDAMFYYAVIRMYNDVVTDVYVINYDNNMPKYTK